MHALLALGFVFALAAATPAVSQPCSLQGDPSAWTRDPHLRLAWERLRQACRDGCAKADVAAYEHDSLEIMADMGPAVGITPDAMRRHVAAIPRQMLKVAEEDPAILADFDKFIVALVGPP